MAEAGIELQPDVAAGDSKPRGERPAVARLDPDIAVAVEEQDGRRSGADMADRLGLRRPRPVAEGSDRGGIVERQEVVGTGKPCEARIAPLSGPSRLGSSASIAAL